MFRGCSSLTTAPALPATTLSTGCYQLMFYGCSSLTTAPELPATTLVTSCYASMFAMCSSLNYVKCMGNPRTSSGNPLSGWLNGVSQTGTFIQDVDVIFTPGPNGVPVGWTTQDSNGILGFKYVEQKVVDSLESNLQLPSSGDSYIFVVYDGSEQLHRVITTTLTTAAGLSVTYPVGSYETMSYTTNSQGMKEIEESEVLRVSKVRIGSGEYTAKPFIAQCAWSGAAVTFRDSLSSSASYLRMSGTNQLTFGSASYQWEFLTSHNSKYYYDIRWTSSSYGNNRYLKQSQIISPTAGDCSMNVGAQPSSSSNGSYTPRYYKRVSYYVS